LIDDSGSIAGRSQIGETDKRPAIKADLPGRLFGGIKGLQAFNPAQDRVSVLFFTILQNTSSCDKRKPRSALPENIFDLIYTGKLQGKDDFANKLAGWMSDDCHFNGNWSPIVISSLMALPFLQDKLPQGELHSQTILIQVTDAEFNAQAKPGHELTAYRQAGLADVAVVDQQLSRISRLFSLNVLPNQESLRGVFYLAAEYSSQRTPESAIQYQRNSLLYPQAVSSDEVRYRLNDQLLGDIQLLSQGKGSEFDFKPLWVRAGFQNSQGGDWRIGGTTLPRLSEKTKPASLNPCELPQCEVSKNSDRLGVGLFEAALGSPLKVSRSSADPEPGQIEFTVGFHYQTPIYDHLCVETPILLIKADPAQPAEIPNLFLPTSKLGKSDVAAEWEQDNDGVTTEEEAKNRVIARRNLHWLELAIFLIVLTGLVMTFLFLRYFRRRFQPRLNWLAAAEVVVDFNRPAASRLLVGTLQVENTEPVPWLGRLLRNDEQPSRPAKISLNYNYFKQSGLNLDDGNPIGFVRGGKTEGASAELDRATLESVSDGKQIYVFLAAEKFRDYQRLEASANGSDAHFAIPFKANLEWGQYRSEAVTRDSILNRFPRWVKTQITSERPGSFSEDFQSNLIVKPEEPRKPLVTYTPSNEAKLYFQKNARVQVGSFWFQSQALHEFAQPYRWEGYIIQTHQGNRPLSGEPIRLAEPVVEVPPWEQVEVPVYVYCDEQTITNPDPVSCEYSFRLLGDFSADSEPGPYTTTLYRDPKRADIELEIIQPRRRIEVYWTSDRTLKLRTMPDGGEVTDLIRDDGAIAIDQQTIKFDARHSSLRELLSFEIDNSGTAGRGVVEVDLTTHIRCDQAVESSIQLISGKRIDDMLGVYDFNIPQPKVVVREGERRQSRAVYLNPGIITRIVSARIEADRIAAEINLAIRVVDDEQAVTERTLTVVIPFSLEQLPSLNWLAIDFGTSAISAALGEGPGERVMMIPLQNISGEGGRSIAAYDVENVESDNENLLPSWICCNADLRDSSGDRSRPGFPGYYSPNLSMLPGEPDFIGLPAVTHEFEKYPGRIIYSLKSWLGRASTGIPIRIKENGNEIQKMLPLEKMVESGFAALAEAYLFEAEYHADQIVITHPNTFTPRHQDLLHGIAYRALGKPKRFGIPLKERVKLISESDAVAYHYCSEQMRGQPRAGDELLLVYDFGAGTLDLSLIKVVWKQDLPRYPLEWKVEKRLGVPLAGNYIDEVLARLIDTLLKDPNIVNPRNFKYVLPIVGRFLDKKNADQHQRAIIRLWHHIREAKHEWSRECRIVLDSGGSLADCPSLKVQVGAGYDLDVIQFVQGQRPDVEEPTDGPGLWLRDSGAIFLSIPARLIESDNRMSQFMDFVTEGVINEALASAGRNADEIDTVIVSGRGARYPELRERVWRHFRNAEMPLLENESMKNAVVLGAIARQGLSRVFEDTSDAAVLAPQLGVLLNYGHNLVLEKDWDKPIDLTASPTFRLVQVNLHAPNPPEDLKSLRKHFYIDLTDHEFVRDDILGDDKHLYVRKEVRDAELAIYLEGENGENRTPVFTEGQIAKTVTSAPWPIGHVLLDPQE
jgi:molecular chaperone DnaK (HSP70)